MKTLYIIRHAKSSWKDLGIGDHDRKLNERGKLSAPFMGKKLAEKGEQIDIYLSSTAKRAFRTARYIAKAFGLKKNEIIQKNELYHAGQRDMLKMINAIHNSHNSAAVFGHNPGFTDLSNHLTGELIDNIPTCGIVKIEFEVDTWEAISGGNGRLIWFDYPKRYPEMQGS